MGQAEVGINNLIAARMEKAKVVASIIGQGWPEVRKVILYGSTARREVNLDHGGLSPDFDIGVVTSEDGFFSNNCFRRHALAVELENAGFQVGTGPGEIHIEDVGIEYIEDPFHPTTPSLARTMVEEGVVIFDRKNLKPEL